MFGWFGGSSSSDSGELADDYDEDATNLQNNTVGQGGTSAELTQDALTAGAEARESYDEAYLKAYEETGDVDAATKAASESESSSK